METFNLFALYGRIPFGINFVTGPCLAYLAMVLNITVFFALFSKTIVSPATVMMQGLALADSFTALFTYGFEPLFHHAYDWVYSWNENPSSIDTGTVITLPYPYCAMHYYTSHMADIFHMVSIFLTTCLGLQKVVAILFPYWSRVGITVKRSSVVCYVCTVVSLCFHIPRILVVTVTDNEGYCHLVENNDSLQYYVLTVYPLLTSVCLGIAGIAMFVSSIIIIGVLCRGRKVLGKKVMLPSEKRSSILIMIVMLIFIITETPRFYLNRNIFNSYQSTGANYDVVFNKSVDKFWDSIQHSLSPDSFDLFFQIRTNQPLENKLTKYDDMIKRWSKHLDRSQAEMELNDKYKNDIRFTLCDIKNNVNFEHCGNNLCNGSTCQCIFDTLINTTEFIDINKVYHGIYENANLYIMSENEILIINHAIDIYVNRVISFFYRRLPILNDLVMGIYEMELFDNCAVIKAFDTTITEMKRFESTITNENEIYLRFILSMSPYSEQLNYLLTTDTEDLTTDLDNLKLLLEIIKLSTIVGCLSNFIIYIILSEKLRNEFRQKLSPEKVGFKLRKCIAYFTEKCRSNKK